MNIPLSEIKVLDCKTGLTDETVNLYRSTDKIVNYPGKTDVFVRGIDEQGLSTPPTKSGPNFTFIKLFNSRHGECVVLYRNGVFYVKRGNGVKPFHSYRSNKSAPEADVFNGILIVVAHNEIPFIFDGRMKFDLGCIEQPSPPLTFPISAPGTHEEVTRGMWCFPNVNWTQSSPISGPAMCERTEPDGTIVQIPGIFKACVQFVDLFGNKGRSSPGGNLAQISPREEVSAKNMYKTNFLVSEWSPPSVSASVAKVIVGRTLNQSSEEDSQATDLMMQEFVLQGSTMHRIVHRMKDETLSGMEQIDATVFALTAGEKVAVWKSRVFISVGNVLYWSDSFFFGQFRDSQTIAMRDPITSITKVGDRLLVVSESSYAVLYDDSGLIRVLEEALPGSVYPRSFAEISNVSIGLWNDGFHMFDGMQRKKIAAPERFAKVPGNDHGMSAIVWGGYYLLSCMYQESERSILMYDLEKDQWYRVIENSLCLSSIGGRLFAVSDSVYELFVGKDWEQARLQVFVNGGDSLSRKFYGVRLLAMPSSSSQDLVEIETDTSSSSSVFSDSLPSESQASRELIKRSYWDKIAQTWDAAKWTNKKPIYIEPLIGRSISGNYFVLTFTHSGSPIELYGLLFDDAPDGKAAR